MKKIIILALSLLLVITMIFAAYADSRQGMLAEKLIRVHIIANSNSPLDQHEKLLVRDRLIEVATPILSNVKSIEEAEKIVSDNLNLFVSEAEKISSYPCRAEVCNASFPTRYYENFTLPAGEYKALRIILGSGEGKNWWCVMFPPLCTTVADAVSVCESANLTEEERALILNGENVYHYEFKILELISKLKSVLV